MVVYVTIYRYIYIYYMVVYVTLGFMLYAFIRQNERYYLPTPPLGQDMTQGQFLSGV